MKQYKLENKYTGEILIRGNLPLCRWRLNLVSSVNKFMYKIIEVC